MIWGLSTEIGAQCILSFTNLMSEGHIHNYYWALYVIQALSDESNNLNTTKALQSTED